MSMAGNSGRGRGHAHDVSRGRGLEAPRSVPTFHAMSQPRHHVLQPRTATTHSVVPGSRHEMWLCGSVADTCASVSICLSLSGLVFRRECLLIGGRSIIDQARSEPDIQWVILSHRQTSSTSRCQAGASKVAFRVEARLADERLRRASPPQRRGWSKAGPRYCRRSTSHATPSQQSPFSPPGLVPPTHSATPPRTSLRPTPA